MEKSRPMFVQAPVATRYAVLGGWELSAEYIDVMALAVCGATVGVGRHVVPSRPDLPWMSGAAAATLQNGLLAPTKTGTSSRPIDLRMAQVL